MYLVDRINRQNSIHMKIVIAIIMSWFLMPILIAQDSTTTCLPKKTLVIRKRQVPMNPPSSQKKETLVVPEEKKIAILEMKTQDSLQSTNSSLERVPAQLPTLAGGDLGLMNIQPYQKKMDLKNWKFVVLQYSVNQYGWVSKVRILKTNDLRLKDVVLRKLKASKWNPALDQSGEPMEYKMYEQVVIVKDRTYEEDYTRDY